MQPLDPFTFRAYMEVRMTLGFRPPIEYPDGPPTWTEDFRELAYNMPIGIFGLVIYGVQLLRGKIPAEMRKSVSIALAIGWAITTLVAILIFVLPADATLSYRIWGASFFLFWAMALSGTLIFNRVHYGFYI